METSAQTRGSLYECGRRSLGGVEVWVINRYIFNLTTFVYTLSCSCRIRVPETGWLQATEMHCLTVPEG